MPTGTVSNRDLPLSSRNKALLIYPDQVLVQWRPFIVLLVYFLLWKLKLISGYCKTCLALRLAWGRAYKSGPPAQPSDILPAQPRAQPTQQTCPVHFFIPFKNPISQSVCYGLIYILLFFYNLVDSLCEYVDHIKYLLRKANEMVKWESVLNNDVHFKYGNCAAARN